MAGDPSELTYFISEKAGFVVIVLRGKLIAATAPTLEGCVSDVLQREGRFFVISLFEVVEVAAALVPAFVRFQKTLRDKGGVLRVCLPDTDVRELFLDKGAVRQNETESDLAGALLALQNEAKQSL
jgi:anti-anti-sigma regulatory factor